MIRHQPLITIVIISRSDSESSDTFLADKLLKHSNVWIGIELFRVKLNDVVS